MFISLSFVSRKSVKRFFFYLSFFLLSLLNVNISNKLHFDGMFKKSSFLTSRRQDQQQSTVQFQNDQGQIQEFRPHFRSKFSNDLGQYRGRRNSFSPIMSLPAMMFETLHNAMSKYYKEAKSKRERSNCRRFSIKRLRGRMFSLEQSGIFGRPAEKFDNR